MFNALIQIISVGVAVPILGAGLAAGTIARVTGGVFVCRHILAKDISPIVVLKTMNVRTVVLGMVEPSSLGLCQITNSRMGEFDCHNPDNPTTARWIANSPHITIS